MKATPVFVAIAVLSLAVSAGHGRPPGTRYSMNVTFADRPGDQVVSDGNRSYVDGVNAFSTLTDKTPPNNDTFSIQAGSLPSLPYHPIRLVIPGQVDQACAYGALRIGNAEPGDFANMPIGSSRFAGGQVECYENANRNNGWNVQFDQCIVIERPTADDFVFRSEVGCMGTLNQVVKRVSSTVGVFEVKFRLDTFKF